jgi:hypothetical protein
VHRYGAARIVNLDHPIVEENAQTDENPSEESDDDGGGW